MSRTRNSQPAPRNARATDRVVTFRRNGRLWTAIVGPSGKLICKRPA